MLPLLLLLPFLLLVMDLLGIGLALMLLMLDMALKVDHQNNHLLDRDQPLSQQPTGVPVLVGFAPALVGSASGSAFALAIYGSGAGYATSIGSRSS